jgi:conjugative transfer region protein TrbK
MMTNRLERLPMAAGAIVALFVVAACAIRLRENESETQSPASLLPKSDSMAAKLKQCRTVSYEQRDALLECQRIWAEKRRQFLGQSGPTTNPDSGAAETRSSSPAPPKDGSRLPPGHHSIPAQSE